MTINNKNDFKYDDNCESIIIVATYNNNKEYNIWGAFGMYLAGIMLFAYIQLFRMESYFSSGVFHNFSYVLFILFHLLNIFPFLLLSKLINFLWPMGNVIFSMKSILM